MKVYMIRQRKYDSEEVFCYEWYLASDKVFARREVAVAFLRVVLPGAAKHPDFGSDESLREYGYRIDELELVD